MMVCESTCSQFYEVTFECMRVTVRIFSSPPHLLLASVPHHTINMTSACWSDWIPTTYYPSQSYEGYIELLAKLARLKRGESTAHDGV